MKDLQQPGGHSGQSHIQRLQNEFSALKNHIAEIKSAEIRKDPSQSILSTLPVGIIEIDADGIIKNLNIKALQFFSKLDLFEPAGKNLTGLISIEEDKNTFQNYLPPNNSYDAASITLKSGNLKKICIEILQSEKHSDKTNIIYFNDITKFKKFEKKLSEEKDKLKGFIDKSNNAFSLVGEDGEVLLWNNAAADITGLPPYEVTGKKIWDVQYAILPDERKNDEYFGFLKQKWVEVLADGEISGADNLEAALKKPDGTIIQFVQTLFSIPTEKGYRIGTILKDVTGEKVMREEIISNIEKLKFLIESMPVLLTAVDENGEFLVWNRECERVTGYKKEEIIDNPDAHLLLYPDPGYRAYLKEEWQKRKHGYRNFEWNITCKDGQTKTISWSDISQEAPVQGWRSWAIGIDITKSKEFEAALIESEKQLRLAHRIGKIGSWEWDVRNNTLKWSDEFILLFGEDPKTFKPNLDYWFSRIHPDDRERIKNLVENSVEGEKTTEMTYRITVNNEVRYLLSKADAEVNKKGRLISARGFVQDITDQVLHEKELNEAKQAAEEASKLKTTLLANMSHEIRTPMNGILGYTQILRSIAAEPNIADMARKIEVSGNRLMNTLNTILEYSQLETETYDAPIEKVNIADVAKHYFNRFRTAAESKGLNYSVLIEQPEIYTDANSRFIEQIIANLLDNAIKFTIEGEIVCRAGIRNGNNTADAFIEIKDTGIGIRKKDQDIIFNEFRQASEGLSRLFEGSGLGLSVVKKMSEKMNANITLESEPGKGSTFTVTLPIKEEYKTEKSVKGSQPGQKHLALEDKTGEKPTLLYVENNETNVEITQLYLEDDYILHHASTGEEALKMIEENKYAAILMDIHLGSGINGVETTKRLRKLPGCADIPVIALTGYTMQDEKNRFREEGIKYYLAKPFTEQELLSQLDEVLRQKQ